MRLIGLGCNTINRTNNNQHNPPAFKGQITIIADNIVKDIHKDIHVWDIIENLLLAIEFQTNRRVNNMLDKIQNDTRLLTLSFTPKFDPDAIMITNVLNAKHINEGVHFKFSKDASELQN